ncbi:MAG: hypothetical protein ACR2KJ_03455 [Jatrophihabitans sp.]
MSGAPTIWRMLPLVVGSGSSSGASLRLDSHDSFAHAVTDTWRTAWTDATTTLDTRVDLGAAVDAVAEWVDRSYTVISGNLATYGGTFSRARAESGFLWRAADLAALLIRIGTEQHNDGFVSRARRVMTDQISIDLTKDTGIRAGTEGLQAVISGYVFEKSHGTTHADWLDYVTTQTDALLALVDAEGNVPFYTDQPTDFSRNAGYLLVPLLVDLYQAGGANRFRTAALLSGTYSWTHGHEQLMFGDSLTDYNGGPPELDREAAYVALRAYLRLFDATKDRTWLARARTAADVAQTWHVIQDIAPVRIGESQEGTNVVTRGNPTLNLAVYSYVSAGTTGADVAGVGWVPEFVELASATGDSHYADFAAHLANTSAQLVNVDDKSGAMGDDRFYTGRGAQNEATAIGVIDYSPQGLNGRGDGLSWPIQWTAFMMLSGLWRLRDTAAGRAILANTRSSDVDDRSATTTWHGSWKRVADAGSWNGSTTVTTTPGASATHVLVGTSVGVYGTKGPTGGRLQVYLDGALQATVDTNAASTTPQSPLWRSGQISFGRHELTLVTLAAASSTTGTTVAVDRFVDGLDYACLPWRVMDTEVAPLLPRELVGHVHPGRHVSYQQPSGRLVHPRLLRTQGRLVRRRVGLHGTGRGVPGRHLQGNG